MTPAPISGRRHVLIAAVLTCLALWSAAPDAHAAAIRIDETGTVVNDPVVNMKWRTPSGGRVMENTVEGTLRVDVRLNLAPWLNQKSRIYMVLAPVNSDRIRARWTTQGRLLPGTLASGERALVYQGPVPTASLVESLLLTLETDGQQLTHQQTLNFHFEIEVSP